MRQGPVVKTNPAKARCTKMHSTDGSMGKAR
ncbi:hypothetical protein ABIE51_002484 [Lysobacter sp. OAE881]